MKEERVGTSEREGWRWRNVGVGWWVRDERVIIIRMNRLTQREGNQMVYHWNLPPFKETAWGGMRTRAERERERQRQRQRQRDRERQRQTDRHRQTDRDRQRQRERLMRGSARQQQIPRYICYHPTDDSQWSL